MTTTPLPMDRPSVIERMAEAKWELNRDIDGKNRVPWSETMEIIKNAERREAEVYLDASGLMEALLQRDQIIESQQQQIRDQDAKLAEMEALVQNADSVMQTNAAMGKRLKSMEAEIARKDEALQFYANQDAEIVKMLAGFSATSDMRDPNSPAEKALTKPQPGKDSA